MLAGFFHKPLHPDSFLPLLIFQETHICTWVRAGGQIAYEARSEIGRGQCRLDLGIRVYKLGNLTQLWFTVVVEFLCTGLY